jgi:hypothetical protein
MGADRGTAAAATEVLSRAHCESGVETDAWGESSGVAVGRSEELAARWFAVEISSQKAEKQRPDAA